MAPSSQLKQHNQENFQQFFIRWKDEQSSQLQQLIAASKTSPKSHSHDPSLNELVNRVTSHYEEYYHVKSNLAQANVLHILSPTWTSPLEDALLWIGGWRPSTAFHLLYSVSGMQLESKITELANLVGTGDLGDLTSTQVGKIDALQRRTIFEEREITGEMAVQQEKVAGVEMVELSREVSEAIRMQRTSHCTSGKRLDSTLLPFKEGFKKILQNADDLRLRTLKGVMDILSPIQGVDFLIAAAELHLRVHDWGKSEEKSSNNCCY